MFVNEVRTLHAMSPGEFDDVLEGPSNFKDWKWELERRLFAMYEPLSNYYHSELHKITDQNDIVISDPAIVDITRLIYNDIIMKVLKGTTSGTIKNEVLHWYDEDVDTDENIAKTIVNRLEETYGKMTFEANFKLTLQFLENCMNGYSEEVQQYYDGCMVALETPILFKSGMLLCTGTDYVKEEMLRKYGHLTDFDEHEFSFTFRKLIAKSPKSSSPSIQSNNRNTRRRSKLPPSPCPHCSGNHWKSECPNLPTVADNVTVLSTIYPHGNPAVTDDCAW